MPPGAAARFSEDDCTAIAQPVPIPSISDFAVRCYFYSARVRANFMQSAKPGLGDRSSFVRERFQILPCILPYFPPQVVPSSSVSQSSGPRFLATRRLFPSRRVQKADHCIMFNASSPRSGSSTTK
ncbi:hypothetical protein KL942_002614 [Ogataea angusta]|uniref:Uncharacterized protein n=1 Tax=Pichia angusta TaxID=870730 RepID=A0ABQ7RZN9_PICAN|nr:hypothetical protein KL942_002614 [Ogataea angusta]KAG7850571.1 hypothetical protein KL940_002131 [Ogataea angusta]